MTDSLYGTKDPSKTKHKPISSSSSLSFSSNLASLISSSTTSKSQTPNTSRPRVPKANKSDIFTTHNKNVKKRSAADLEQEQPHQTKHDIGAVSTSELHRSKRKMEEKVRLYNAMKRGEYIGRDGADAHDRGLVDFDRKWADAQARGSRDSASEHDSDSDSSSSEPPQSTTEPITYLDEFGRLRTGTASEARRVARRTRLAAAAASESAQLAAHPERPANIIYGDTVQHHAFNPDRITTEKMDLLAAKRDRSATPPPETHYDASGEIRNRGTGFYGFSKDEELRKKEMEELERERLETEKAREMKKEDVKEKRKREIEERKRIIAEKRSQKQADKFLDELELDGS